MSLKEFIKKNKQELGSDLRCGSCGNSLSECGKYEIVQVELPAVEGQKGKVSEEGILCETCQKNGRKLARVTRIIETKATAVKQVSNVPINDIDKKRIQEKEDIKEQYKKKEAESITELQTKPAPTKIEALTKQELESRKSNNNNKKED